MNDLFYTPGWLRKAAEERWARERESEIRRVEQNMAEDEEQKRLMAEDERLAFLVDREERIARLKERDEAIKEFENLYGLQGKLQPVEVAKPQPLPTRLLPICLLPECEYTRERRIFAPPINRLSRDAQHRSWDGYEWAII